ncbi:MAG: YfhO family protein [Acidimicrobiales bacterium]
MVDGPDGGAEANPAEATLQRKVGSALVGLGTGSCIFPPGLGILPNVNIMLGVHQMAVYDPLLPKQTFASWQRYTGASGGFEDISTFCPVVTSAIVARRFGIGYALNHPGAGAPTGSTFVERIGVGQGAEDLYRVPGAAAATLSALPSDRVLPSGSISGTPVAVRRPDPATWKVVTDATKASLLTLHLGNAPGWHAGLDGNPLSLHTSSGIALGARVPPGHHTVVVRYWPESFTVGIVLFALAVAGFAGGALVVGQGHRLALAIPDPSDVSDCPAVPLAEKSRDTDSGEISRLGSLRAYWAGSHSANWRIEFRV